jgi:dCMP deaminase
MNCIYNATLNGVSLNDSTLYVYGLPVCSECAKGVIQVGVKRVVIYTPNVYKEDLSDKWKESGSLAEEMFNETNVEFCWYDNLV